jgi:hypothetical protein
VPQGTNEILGEQHRGTVMEKKKIAESIIIRVGGGIREITRETVESQDIMESPHSESDFEQPEEIHAFRSKIGPASTNSKDKAIS